MNRGLKVQNAADLVVYLLKSHIERPDEQGTESQRASWHHMTNFVSHIERPDEQGTESHQHTILRYSFDRGHIERPDEQGTESVMASAIAIWVLTSH